MHTLHSKIMIFKKIIFFFENTRVSNRIVQTNMQLLVNNDYEHASISMVGKEKMFVCWNYRCLLSLIVDESDYRWWW
jgi:hypothetical protein